MKFSSIDLSSVCLFLSLCLNVVSSVGVKPLFFFGPRARSSLSCVGASP
jgi:hypothetical protein